MDCTLYEAIHNAVGFLPAHTADRMIKNTCQSLLDGQKPGFEYVGMYHLDSNISAEDWCADWLEFGDCDVTADDEIYVIVGLVADETGIRMVAGLCGLTPFVEEFKNVNRDDLLEIIQER